MADVTLRRRLPADLTSTRRRAPRWIATPIQPFVGVSPFGGDTFVVAVGLDGPLPF